MIEPDQWQLLCLRHTGKRGTAARSLTQAVRCIAMLDGRLGRCNDRNPGITTIWRDLMILTQMTIALHLAQHAPELVGNV